MSDRLVIGPGEFLEVFLDAAGPMLFDPTPPHALAAGDRRKPVSAACADTEDGWAGLLTLLVKLKLLQRQYAGERVPAEDVEDEDFRLVRQIATEAMSVGIKAIEARYGRGNIHFDKRKSKALFLEVEAGRLLRNPPVHGSIAQQVAEIARRSGSSKTAIYRVRAKLLASRES